MYHARLQLPSPWGVQLGDVRRGEREVTVKGEKLLQRTMAFCGGSVEIVGSEVSSGDRDSRDEDREEGQQDESHEELHVGHHRRVSGVLFTRRRLCQQSTAVFKR